MTSFQAGCAKEWRLHKSVALDSVIAAVLGCLLLPLDGGLGMLLLGGLAAVRIGTRLGADLSGVDTWEFLLTRPIDRRAYVRERMRVGLIPVVAVCALVALLDAVDAHAAFAHLFVDAAPWIDAAPAPIGAGTLCMLPVVFLLFVTGFERGLARGGTDQAHGAAFEAAVIGLFIAGGVSVLTTMTLYVLMPAASTFGLLHDDPDTDSAAAYVMNEGPATCVALAVILGIAALTWRRCELAVQRKEIVAASRPSGASVVTWIVVASLLLAAALLFVYVRASGASVSGGK